MFKNSLIFISLWPSFILRNCQMLDIFASLFKQLRPIIKLYKLIFGISVRSLHKVKNFRHEFRLLQILIIFQNSECLDTGPGKGQNLPSGSWKNLGSEIWSLDFLRGVRLKENLFLSSMKIKKNEKVLTVNFSKTHVTMNIN